MGDVVKDDLLDLLATGHPPAFATDSRSRIIFWNRGAADLLGRRPEDALGRHCYELLQARDVFGNRFCYADCAVMASLREGHGVDGFELEMSANGHDRRLMGITILRIPSVRSDLFTVLHFLQPIEPESRVLRDLRRLGVGRVVEPLPVPAAHVPPRELTARETEILELMAAGRQNKELAQVLDLSLATVRNHVHNILDKLAVHSKLEAVCLAFRNGWVRGGRPTAAQPTAPELRPQAPDRERDAREARPGDYARR